jgi:hypothetical protein
VAFPVPQGILALKTSGSLDALQNRIQKPLTFTPYQCARDTLEFAQHLYQLLVKVKPFIERGRVAYRNLLEALHATGVEAGFNAFRRFRAE